MKKALSVLLTGVLTVGLLTGCGKKEVSENSIIIGVSPEPHAKIVELVIDDLKAEGIDVEVKEFTDYVIPNTVLNDGEIDANFFQHKPYLDNFNEKQGTKLVSIGGIHVEPMALYSENFTSIEELKDGAQIAIPNDSVNGARALILLESEGIIKIDPNAGIEATENDIVDNPKNLKFKAVEAASLPSILDDVDFAIINGNYAIDAGLNPLVDGILIEGEDSPYANIIAVREGEENSEKFTKLLEALQSEKVKEFILETYDGGVVPAF